MKLVFHYIKYINVLFYISIIFLKSNSLKIYNDLRYISTVNKYKVLQIKKRSNLKKNHNIRKMKLLNNRFVVLCPIIILFFFLNSVVLGNNNRNNINFHETENAAKAMRKLLSGEINSIKLDNGDELKIKLNDEKHKDSTKWDKSYSFISNLEEEKYSQTDLFRKKQEINEANTKIIEDRQEFYILNNDEIENIATRFVLENNFDELYIQSFKQSLIDIIQSLNN